jgi:hypothetical protein
MKFREKLGKERGKKRKTFPSMKNLFKKFD